MLGRKDQVGRKRQFKAAADRHAVQCRDYWLVEADQLLQAAEPANAVVVIWGFVASRRCLQVPAGGKEFFTTAGDDRDAQVRVIAEFPESLAERPRGHIVDRVRLRPVERHFENLVAVQYGFYSVRHGKSRMEGDPRGIAGPSR